MMMMMMMMKMISGCRRLASMSYQLKPADSAISSSSSRSQYLLKSNRLHQFKSQFQIIPNNPNLYLLSNPYQPLSTNSLGLGLGLGLGVRFCSHSQSKQNHDGDMKHQEIEGPTVERDLSPLADETRHVTHSLIDTIYNLSNLLALLALSQLAVGAFISYSNNNQKLLLMMMITSALGFGLPFSMAFLLRYSIKSMTFFQKMEMIGRLQILTSTMQISKQLHLFFIRLRTITYLCLASFPLAFLFSLFSPSSS